MRLSETADCWMDYHGRGTRSNAAWNDGRIRTKNSLCLDSLVIMLTFSCPVYVTLLLMP